jgi:hypothetical protein
LSHYNPFFGKFWKKFKKVSESIIFSGCGTSKDITACIEKQIEGAIKFRKGQLKKAKSKKEKEELKRKILDMMELLNDNFAIRAETEYWKNSHPIYRERLGSLDDLIEPKFYKNYFYKPK